MQPLAERCAFFILGEDAEQQVEFYSILISSNPFAESDGEIISVREDFAIGVVSQGLGLKPNLLILLERDALMLGFNSEAVIFGMSIKEVFRRVSLNYSPFKAFLHLSESNLVLVFHEIGRCWPCLLRTRYADLWQTHGIDCTMKSCFKHKTRSCV